MIFPSHFLPLDKTVLFLFYFFILFYLFNTLINMIFNVLLHIFPPFSICICITITKFTFFKTHTKLPKALRINCKFYNILLRKSLRTFEWEDFLQG